ncbi:MAG TPA: phage tail sheath subtilisin-like domain-containing protein [Kaistia sp.]|nr:phage tail sheath subtilisin-like domain-containing protein [Kaistia sp.]
MPVSFNTIPADFNLPLYYVEVDPSKAGQVVLDQPGLMVGQKLAAGSAVADVPIAVGSLAQAQAYFGIGSMLERMVATFFKNNQAQELWCLPLAEPGAGVAATGQIAITGPATAAGTLSVYIAGQRVQIAVAAAATATAIGAALATAINAMTTLPVTAVSTTGTLALTARWKGLTGNDVHIGMNLGGVAAGEATPAGVAIAITAMAGGTAAPTMTTGMAGLGDDPYEYVAFPFTDSTSLNAIEAEFGFGDAGRWGWMRQLYGHVFSAARGTYSALITLGTSRNSGVTSILGVEVATPTPIWEIAAAYAAQAARALLNDPARPLQTLPLLGVAAAAKGSRFAMLERNTLTKSGIAVTAILPDGTVQISREATTYQTNTLGTPDTAYNLVTTLATLARLFRNQKQAITSKYARHKLANNGTKFGAGQAIVTPNVIRAELVAQYENDEFNGLVENADAFAANLVVERDSLNPNRVNVLYPPDLVNQLRMFAVLAQFRLQYTDAAA